MLSPAQIAQRDGKLTASRVGALMSGEPQKIHDLWCEMIGDPTYTPPDLSNVFAVQFGSYTEPFNLDWYERMTGRPVTRRGEVAVHPIYQWAACTLDGMDEQARRVVEAKHVGGFEKISAILERYAAQGHWQMLVTNTTQCAFSIIEGNREPIIEIMEYDHEYGAELFRRAEQFMQCVWNLTPPVELPAVAPPAKAEKFYDLTGNNRWASEAATWLSTCQAAKDHAAAVKALKEIVPLDAAKCIGHGIGISRSRAGALTIRPLE